MRRVPGLLLIVLFVAGVSHAQDDLLAGFKAEYGSPTANENTRLAAVTEVAKIESQVKVTEALAGVLAKDSSSKVRIAAAQALAKQWSAAKAVEALTKALANPKEDDDVVLAIIEALGETGTDAAVGPLAGLLAPRSRAYRGSELRAQDKLNVSITTAALGALKKNASAKAIEPVLEFLSREVPQWGPERRRERQTAADPLIKHGEAVLVALSGEHYQGLRAWTSWWAENKSKLKTYAVHRCDQTGKTFEKAQSTARCPVDGDQHPRCGTFLRTRLEGGATGDDDDDDARPGKPGKKRKKP